GQAGDELELERLLGEDPARLLELDDAAAKLVAAADDLLHPLLDPGEILLGDRRGELEVIEEAGVGGGADPEVGAGVKLGHRLGHDVGQGVTDAVKLLCHRRELLLIALFGHGPGSLLANAEAVHAPGRGCYSSPR